MAWARRAELKSSNCHTQPLAASKRLPGILRKRREKWKCAAGVLLLCAAGISFSGSALAQGQDSTPQARNTQVIAELLARVFDNYNQVYFDKRLGKPQASRHARMEIRVDRIGGADSMLLVYREFADGDYSSLTRAGILALAADNEKNATRMAVWNLPVADLSPSVEAAGVSERPARPPDCTVLWQREAAQFRGRAQGECRAWASESVLSEQQLWLTAPGGSAHPGGAFQLHAARMMRCYIDVPGVSSGRDEAFTRYDGLMVHDRGGTARVTTEEGRQLGLRLSNVDWPLNNYTGVFTRDVLVLYVLEFVDEETKSHGYIFTEPEAERIGINLYWMLAYCYMTSNTEVKPFM